jgi:hypothetical protein
MIGQRAPIRERLGLLPLLGPAVGPALMLGLLLVRLRQSFVRLPYMDAWALIFLADSNRQFGIRLDVVTTPHNEHLLVLPKLWWSLTAVRGRWTPIPDLVLSIAAIVVTIAVVVMGCHSLHSMWREVVAAVAVSAVLTSFTHGENLIWSFQSAVFVTHAALVCGCYLMAQASISTVPRKRILRIAAAVGAGVIATLCNKSGFMALVIILLWAALLVPGQIPKAAAMVTALASSVGLLLFYTRLAPAVSLGSDLSVTKQPVRVVGIALAQLSAALATSLTEVQWWWRVPLGIAVGAVLGLGMCRLWQDRGKEHDQGLLFFSGLGIYAGAVAAASAVQRGNWTTTVVASRYSTSNVFGVIAAVGVLGCLWKSKWATVAIAAIATVSIATSARLFPEYNQLAKARNRARPCIELVNYLDTQLDLESDSCVYPLFPFQLDNYLTRPAALAIAMDVLPGIDPGALIGEPITADGDQRLETVGGFLSLAALPDACTGLLGISLDNGKTFVQAKQVRAGSSGAVRWTLPASRHGQNQSLFLVCRSNTGADEFRQLMVV